MQLTLTFACKLRFTVLATLCLVDESQSVFKSLHLNYRSLKWLNWIHSGDYCIWWVVTRASHLLCHL